MVRKVSPVLKIQDILFRIFFLLFKCSCNTYTSTVIPLPLQPVWTALGKFLYKIIVFMNLHVEVGNFIKLSNVIKTATMILKPDNNDLVKLDKFIIYYYIDLKICVKLKMERGLFSGQALCLKMRKIWIQIPTKEEKKIFGWYSNYCWWPLVETTVLVNT